MDNNLQRLIDELSKSATNTDMFGFVLCILVSLLGSVIVMLMYLALYDKKDSASGVYKAFLVIGPAVTAMFLAIQYSLPLSLGLLGALSFIRFRTPIKDPEEVSYILLLIAFSITSATYNFALGGIVLTVVFLALLIKKKMLTGNFFSRERGHVLIALADGAINERSVTKIIQDKLKNANLKNISKSGEAVQFHYSFKGRTDVPYEELLNELNKISEVHNLNIVMDEGIL